jgi:Icc-related predicted phosphoesterase
MNITALSDLHGQYPPIPSNRQGVLILAGDVLSDYEDPEEFFTWIDGLKFKKKLLIPGNHDKLIAVNPEIFEKHTDLLIDQELRFGKEIFYGSPWVNISCGRTWAFVEPESMLYYRWLKIPNNTTCLITHSPPYGILDGHYLGEKLGSLSLKDRINELPFLKYHFFGHIHEHGGEEKDIGGKRYMNVARTIKRINVL